MVDRLAELQAGGLPDVFAAHLLAAVRVAEPGVLAAAVRPGAGWVGLAGLGMARRRQGRPWRRAGRLGRLGPVLGTHGLGFPVAPAGADPLAGRLHRTSVPVAGRRAAGAGVAGRRAGPRRPAAPRIRPGVAAVGAAAPSAARRLWREGPGRRPSSSAWPATRRRSPRWACCCCCAARAGRCAPCGCCHWPGARSAPPPCGPWGQRKAGCRLRRCCWRAWRRGVAEAPHSQTAGRAAMDAAVGSV